MSLKVATRKVGEVTVVDLSGRITLGEGATQLRGAIRYLTHNQRQRSILLNMGDVTYMDTTGIGELVSSFTIVGNIGGHLKLLKLKGKPKQFLEVTKLLTVFDCFESEDEAVRSFE